MTLSPTHFDPRPSGKVTLPMLPDDMPAQPVAEEDVSRLDHHQKDSFDMIFSHSGASAQVLPAPPMPRSGQTPEAGQPEKSAGDPLKVAETEFMETPDNHPFPEMIDPKALEITVQRTQGVIKDEMYPDKSPDNSEVAVSGTTESPEAAHEMAVMPDDNLSPMPRSTVPEQADIDKPQAEILSQAGRVTAFDLAARSTSSMPVAVVNPPSVTQSKMAKTGTDYAQNGKSVQQVQDLLHPTELTRGAAPDLPGMSVIKAGAYVAPAFSGQVWAVSEKAAEPRVSMRDRGTISPAATESGRPTPLVGLDAPHQALPEVDMRSPRDDVWDNAAKRSERNAAGMPGFATPAVSDDLISKTSQTVLLPASPLPTVSAGFVPMEEVRLSRVGFQSDIGAATDQRTLPEILHTGRSDAPARGDLPRHVAAQLAEAVNRSGSGDRPIEVTLNPSELGRVRISMAPGDGTIIVTVLAERGETLDLMRRHADQLAQDFHDLGYGSAEFAFGQNSDEQGGAQGGAAGGTVAPSDTSLSSDAAPRPIHLNADRVDIRL